MTPDDVLSLYDQEVRRGATGPGVHVDEDGDAIRWITPRDDGGMSFVIFSRLDESTADAAIARQVAFFRARNQPVEWKLYHHDQPADLGHRLVENGFVPGNEDSIMALELAQAPIELLADDQSAVRRVDDAAGLEGVRQVMAAVWDGDFAWLPRRLARQIAAGYAAVYLAELDGQPAAAAWALFPKDNDFAGLWAGSTREAYRGRGLYRALLAARIHEAVRRGRRFVTIDAGPMSRPIVARYGFREIARAREYVWSPPQTEEQAS